MITTSKEKEKLFNYIRDIEWMTRQTERLEEEKQNYERKISKKKNTILDMITVKEDD
jgi:hypothetical protein